MAYYPAWTKEKGEREFRCLLERVNLQNNAHTKVRALSGGMKRRLGIAQAILHNPRVLIVDEPTAGLDQEERVRFRNLLSEIAEERIVILSTHIVGDVEAACEEIAVMDRGKYSFQRQGAGTDLGWWKAEYIRRKSAEKNWSCMKERIHM